MKDQVSKSGNVVDARKVRFGFKVTSIDVENRRCNVTVHQVIGEEVKNKSLKNIMISSLLMWKFNNQVEDYEVGKYYESDLAGSDWRENPFQLIRLRNQEGEITFLLACVNERGSWVKKEELLFDGYSAERMWKYYKREQYRRYRNRVTKEPRS